MTTEYDKIWLEVDVLQERDIKTEKMQACIKALKKVPYIVNVTKATYVPKNADT